MRRVSLGAAVLALALCAPVHVFAAGIAGATVRLVDTVTTVAFGTATTDADGAFLFEGVPAGAYSLEVDTADLKGQSRQLFDLAADKAPARIAGRVTTLEGADLSLQVNAAITAPGTGAIALNPGYPKVQRAWNRNWTHAAGKLHVRLAGTGLEGLEKVVLTSATGSIESTVIVLDPEDGEYHAIFPKAAAFTALVPADAGRGTAVQVSVGVTTATGTGSYDVWVRIVGPKMAPRH
ncbi:MAG TPA: carboxypeptidase regulatory-like domain-containing protein [bacterium]